MTDSDTDDDGTVRVSVSTLENQSAMDKAAETTQLDERRIATDVGRGIVPPYNPESLAAFQELNETHQACLRKKARYEVAYGFDIVPHPYADDPDPNGEQRKAVKDFWHGFDARWQTGPEGTATATPEEVLELARLDYHGIGWSALEILVEGDGTPVGLAHVPAATVRVRKTETDDGDVVSGHGYVQIRQGRRRYFGEAGDRYADDPTFVDKESGDVDDAVENLENDPANELIFIPNPSPLSLYYGIPDWVAAMQTMAADQAAKEWNHDIFDNLGIPHYAIKVTGGTLTEASKEELRDLQNNLKGEPYRTAILEVEEFVDRNELATEDGSDVDIEFEPLGATTSNDMEFESFRERNEHEIAKVHSVPPVLIGVTDTSNRANSKEQTREFAKNTIEPEQAKFSARLYKIIHQTALEVDDWTLEFELRGADQPKQDAGVARTRIAASRGSMTVNEAREELGLGAFTDDEGEPLPIGEQPLADLDNSPDNESGFGAPKSAGPADSQCVGTRADVSVKMPVDMQEFESSNLVAGLYDYETRDLYIRFHGDPTDRIYVYLDVSAETWSGLVNASSHGSYHHENIKWDYVYEELSATDWPQVGASAPTNNKLVSEFLAA
jgi:PBSX family phage portal protein